MKKTFQTPGYEDMELSTQIIIAEALKRKVKVEILDRPSQFIRLQKGKHIEYLESGTKTSRDSYITSEILGNKKVTKIILAEAGITVPKGQTFTSMEEALKVEKKWIGRKSAPFVIKPKTTNYGIGVQIMEKKTTSSKYRQAIREAFKYDRSVLIEKFIPGNEYRFLVIGKKTQAVLNRIPANVTGDGKNTIKELVRLKNSNPLRGEGHKTPLEKIKLGSTEKNVLKEQNLTPLSVPGKGKKILLRRNSNISTGGDSIDFTDSMHPTYCRIAEKAAKTANASICGVDILIQNCKKAASLNNHAVIELNYNPVLYFHNFPYKGKNRNTGKFVLNLLGFSTD